MLNFCVLDFYFYLFKVNEINEFFFWKKFMDLGMYYVN